MGWCMHARMADTPTEVVVAVQPTTGRHAAVRAGGTGRAATRHGATRHGGRRARPAPHPSRRPGVLLGALLAGGLAAAAFGFTGTAGASSESTSVLAAQQRMLGAEEQLEVLPQASVTVAEAQARLQEVAASRAARAEAAAQAEAAAAEAAAAAAEAARPKTVLPIDGARLTSGYGGRWGTFHYGIDLAAPMRTPEYAAADGVVLRAGSASGFGLAVYILHENGDVTVYGHMDKILVEPGEYVDAGETIALLGNRGQSTGPHLHFEVHKGGMDGKRVDPLPWLRDRGVDI
jgi:murein DD-endopeptidase MepM/ murein hydrolase activator NlpD